MSTETLPTRSSQYPCLMPSKVVVSNGQATIKWGDKEITTHPVELWQEICESRRDDPAYREVERLLKLELDRSGKNDKKNRPRAVSFRMFPDGDMVQSCYDIKTETPFFIHWVASESKVETINEIVDPVTLERLVPLNDKDVQLGQLLLPSNAEDYTSISSLIRELTLFIDRWVELPASMKGYFVMAIIQTWIFEKCPQLQINDFRADHSAGKTRALTVALFLSYQGYRASGADTIASIIRIIDKWHPTLCINENDLNNSDMTSDYAKMLNERTDPMGVKHLNVQTPEGGWESIPFKVFGPTFTTTRQPYTDNALESRCVHFRMAETDRDDILLNIPPKFREEAEILRNKLLLFRFKHFAKMENDYYLVVPRVRKRTLQVMQPVLSLVKSIDPSSYDDVIKMLQEMDRDSNEANYESEIGHIIRAIYNLENPVPAEGQEFVERPNDSPSSKAISERIERLFGEKVSPVIVGRTLSGLGLKQVKKKERGWSLGEGKKRDKLLNKYCPEYNLPTDETDRMTLENPRFSGKPAKNLPTDETDKTDVAG